MKLSKWADSLQNPYQNNDEIIKIEYCILFINAFLKVTFKIAACTICVPFFECIQCLKQRNPGNILALSVKNMMGLPSCIIIGNKSL